MSRLKHSNCVNTPEGIRRINEEQAFYDKDPEEYERQNRAADEERQQREEWERQEYERQEEERGDY